MGAYERYFEFLDTNLGNTEFIKAAECWEGRNVNVDLYTTKEVLDLWWARFFLALSLKRIECNTHYQCLESRHLEIKFPALYAIFSDMLMSFRIQPITLIVIEDALSKNCNMRQSSEVKEESWRSIPFENLPLKQRHIIPDIVC